MAREVDEPEDVLVPPWLWPTFEVWAHVSGQWRTHGDQLLAIDICAMAIVMDWLGVPQAERAGIAQFVRVIEGHVRQSLESRQKRR